ncbi:hypothetical protein ACFLXT_04525 [Chloroflexota bacterium]
MGERTKVAKARSIYRLVVYGIAGFGAGGTIGGAIWVAFDAPHLGFAILGALGGISLSPNLKDWKATTIIALACAIGFDIGFLLPFFVSLVIWEPVYSQGIFVGGIGGAMGGMSLGFGTKKWSKTWLLALVGAIGFGIAAQAFWGILRGLEPQILWGAATLAIWGIVGGASLGAALGYVEKKKITRITSS